MMKSQIEAWLLDWFAERNPGVQLSLDMDIYNHNLVDSFGVVELIIAIETEFRIKLEDSELASADFRSLHGLLSIIEKKLAK